MSSGSAAGGKGETTAADVNLVSTSLSGPVPPEAGRGGIPLVDSTLSADLEQVPEIIFPVQVQQVQNTELDTGMESAMLTSMVSLPPPLESANEVQDTYARHQFSDADGGQSRSHSQLEVVDLRALRPKKQAVPTHVAAYCRALAQR